MKTTMLTAHALHLWLRQPRTMHPCSNNVMETCKTPGRDTHFSYIIKPMHCTCGLVRGGAQGKELLTLRHKRPRQRASFPCTDLAHAQPVAHAAMGLLGVDHCQVVQ